MFFRTSKYEVYITIDVITTIWYTVDINDLHIRVLNIYIIVSKM